jgi:hypothetical protein
MSGLTIEELFSNGLFSMESSDYTAAEKWFMSVLYRYCQTEEGYMESIGARDRLSELYAKGATPDEARALDYLESLSAVDKVAAKYYAYALINGVYGEPDYKTAIECLSRCFVDDQLYPMAYLLANGYGVEKNIQRAVCLLHAAQAEQDDRADELLKSLEEKHGSESDRSDRVATKKKSWELLNEIYSELDITPVKPEKSVDEVIRKFLTGKSVRDLIGNSGSLPDKVLRIFKRT